METNLEKYTPGCQKGIVGGGGGGAREGRVMRKDGQVSKDGGKKPYTGLGCFIRETATKNFCLGEFPSWVSRNESD